MHRVSRHLPKGSNRQLNDRQGVTMSYQSCLLCQSANQREFPVEMNIHFPGMKGLEIPTVWFFPTIVVCMDCGTAQFAIPDPQRKTLADRDYRGWADDAAV